MTRTTRSSFNAFRLFGVAITVAVLSTAALSVWAYGGPGGFGMHGGPGAGMMHDGPGIGMIKLESPVANRVREAMAAGVKAVACENTMTNLKLAKGDMLPSLGYVPAGAVQLMRRQREGYAYIRP